MEHMVMDNKGNPWGHSTRGREYAQGIFGGNGARDRVLGPG